MQIKITAVCIVLATMACHAQPGSPRPLRQEKPRPRSEESIKREESPSTADVPFDHVRSEEAALVLRAQALEFKGADKYAWTRIRIVKILKGESALSVGAEMEVATYSWSGPIPTAECTLYLEPFSSVPNHPWKLLGGSVERGVSHVQ